MFILLISVFLCCSSIALHAVEVMNRKSVHANSVRYGSFFAPLNTHTYIFCSFVCLSAKKKANWKETACQCPVQNCLHRTQHTQIYKMLSGHEKKAVACNYSTLLLVIRLWHETTPQVVILCEIIRAQYFASYHWRFANRCAVVCFE